MDMQTDLEHMEEASVDPALMVDKAKDKAEAAGQVVKQQAKRVAAGVSEQAKSTVETRKDGVAEDLGTVAEVIRQTSYEAASDNPTLMEYGQRIANQLEGVSTYLDNHGLDEILTDAQSFARRQPAVFLGGAFMLGLAVGRFLRSSSSQIGGTMMSGSDVSGQGRIYRAPAYQQAYRSSDRAGYNTGQSSESMTSLDNVPSKE